MPKSDLALASADYTPVAERVRMFYEIYPRGQICTHLVRCDDREVVVKAAVYRSAHDARPSATGYAMEKRDDGEINAVACLENAETSAVGRALANLNFPSSPARAGTTWGALKARAALASGGAASSPTGRVAEPAPPPPATRQRTRGVDERLQREAGIAHDVLDLVNRAQGLGLSSHRAAALRGRLLYERLTERQLERLEVALRAWLRRHEGGESATDPSGRP
jgi:hypothetical protein